jgi:hypothetical protein
VYNLALIQVEFLEKEVVGIPGINRELNQKMKYHAIAVFVIWLVLGTGLAAAGTLFVNLSPSLDGKEGIIKATSIMKAELISPAENKTGIIINGQARFNLTANDAGEGFIRINDLISDPIPTRIDDPTKDINQFVGENLQVSVIGSLSDPTYMIKTLTKTPGARTIWCSDGTNVTSDALTYIILSLKTKPQKLEIKRLGGYSKSAVSRITDYKLSTPTHPSTTTSINPPSSKWVFSHGADYGRDDSKCNSCHGDLDMKPANLDSKRDNFIEIPVSRGFCYRCHYGKSGISAGLVGEPGCWHTYPSPEFEAVPVFAVLLIALLIKRKKYWKLQAL